MLMIQIFYDTHTGVIFDIMSSRIPKPHDQLYAEYKLIMMLKMN